MSEGPGPGEILPPIDTFQALRDCIPVCRHCLYPVWYHPMLVTWLHEISQYRHCESNRADGPLAEPFPLYPDRNTAHGRKRTADEGELVAAATYARCMSG